MTERFADYLCYGPPFTVFTDNIPLTYVLTSAKLNASGLRWVAELSNYQFTIQNKPGKKNGNADGLSPQSENLKELEEKCTELMNFKGLSTVMSVSINSIESSCYQHVDVNILQLSEPSDIEPIKREDLIQCQYDDSVIGPVYKCVDEGKRPSKSELSTLGRKSKVLLHQFSKLKI